MIAVLVSTHGPMANSIIESAEMICGKQTQCEAVPFLTEQSLDDFQQQIEQTLTMLTQEGQTLLCFVDLKGGTPFNTLTRLMANYPNLEIVTGVNIPMLLATFMLRTQMALDDLLPELMQTAQQSIEHYNIVSMTSSIIEDEEF
ncbi:hypothetical protein A9G09_05610 [Gilliamella sp. wkB292]|uniref:PTS sugar transporter subunit IIA n=1 Tax=unclassified Gilliamella TaxID=2685620 RepID=UPI00080E9879|nr:PTS sugar transporter subunit IIA [Gilliamella apicola]OCG14526.1 hypothetical protein A9G09_05610 [Gilliamella apicola]OCL16265.1 hypothetical protein A9G03_11665 [Gilliamella apicola]